LFINFSSKKIK